MLQLGDGTMDGTGVYVRYKGWKAKWDSWARLEHTRRITPETRAERARMSVEFNNKADEAKRRQRSREAAGIGTGATHQSVDRYY